MVRCAVEIQLFNCIPGLLLAFVCAATLQLCLCDSSCAAAARLCHYSAATQLSSRPDPTILPHCATALLCSDTAQHRGVPPVSPFPPTSFRQPNITPRPLFPRRPPRGTALSPSPPLSPRSPDTCKGPVPRAHRPYGAGEPRSASAGLGGPSLRGGCLTRRHLPQGKHARRPRRATRSPKAAATLGSSGREVGVSPEGAGGCPRRSALALSPQETCRRPHCRLRARPPLPAGRRAELSAELPTARPAKVSWDPAAAPNRRQCHQPSAVPPRQVTLSPTANPPSWPAAAPPPAAPRPAAPPAPAGTAQGAAPARTPWLPARRRRSDEAARGR